MELLYIYVKDYGILKDVEFHFSDKFIFEFDLTHNTLSVEQNKKALPPNFFTSESNSVTTEIRNISALVGNNGAGKTSIARILSSIFTGVKVECIIAILEDGAEHPMFYDFFIPKFFRSEIAKNNFLASVKKKQIYIRKHLDAETWLDDTYIKKGECWILGPDWTSSNNNYQLLSSICFQEREIRGPLEICSKNELQRDYERNRLIDFEFYDHSKGETPVESEFIYTSSFYHPLHNIRSVELTDEMKDSDKTHDISTSALMTKDFIKAYGVYESSITALADNNININRIAGHDLMDIRRNVKFFTDFKILEKKGMVSSEWTLPQPKGILLSFNQTAVDLFLNQKRQQANGQDSLLILLNLLREKSRTHGHSAKIAFLFNFSLNFLCNFFRHYKAFPQDPAFTRILDLQCKKLTGEFPRGECITVEKFTNVIGPFLNGINDIKYIDSDGIPTTLPTGELGQAEKVLEALVLINNDCFKCEGKVIRITFHKVEQFDASLDLFERYFLSTSIFDYFDFEWFPRVSAGEYTQLNIFSRLYSLCLDNVLNKKKSLIVFFDEIEITIHPELQRRLVSNMITFFETFFNRGKVQLIFATHSPILLSDIPKSNVSFMKRYNPGDDYFDENENNGFPYITINENTNAMTNTFAANIHSLYRHSFFLESGSMGTFATDKINKLLELCEMQQNELIQQVKELKINLIKLFKRSESIIEAIGEPYLKELVFEKFEESVLYTLINSAEYEDDIDEQIQHFENKLIKLKEMQNLRGQE